MNDNPRWTMESFMEAHKDDFPNGVPPEMSTPDTPPEFIKAVDDYAEAIESAVLARAQVRKWEAEAARLRHLLIELEAQER